MKRIFTLLLSTLLTLPALAQLQTGLSLPYLVQEPAKKSEHPPVLILMHGYGSNENDLFELKDGLPKNFLIISVRAPLTLSEGSYQWFRMEEVKGERQPNKEDVKNSTEKMKTFIREVVKQYQADSTKVYLSGFSQGGMMSFAVGLTNPQLVHGIAPMSGKIFDFIKPQVKMSRQLKALKIFIAHGDADDRVPYTNATDAEIYLKVQGLTPVLHTYKGLKHSISATEIKELSQWLMEGD